MRDRLPTLPYVPTVRVRLSQGLMTLSVESAGLGCIVGLPLVPTQRQAHKLVAM